MVTLTLVIGNWSKLLYSTVSWVEMMGSMIVVPPNSAVGCVLNASGSFRLISFNICLVCSYCG